MFTHKYIDISKISQSQISQSQISQISQSQISKESKGQAFPELSIVGIFVFISFYALFINIYASASYEGKLGISLQSKHGFTLSEAFKYGHRKTTTILCVLFTGLYMGLLIDKGFFSNISTGTEDSYNTFKTGVVVLNFCMLLGFLFLFLVPPPHENNLYQSVIHFAVTIFIILFILISSVLITYIYNKEYNNNNIITAMNGLTGSILTLSLIIIITGVSSMFVGNHIKQLLWRILASAEIGIIILYSVVIILFSLMPKLIDYKKICVGVHI